MTAPKTRVFMSIPIDRRERGCWWWALIAALLLAPSCTIRNTPPSQLSGPTVTFVRHEDNGAVNIQPADVIIDGRLAATIAGGETRHVSVSSGQHSVSVQSANPYEPGSNRNSWNSKPLKVALRPAERIII